MSGLYVLRQWVRHAVTAAQDSTESHLWEKHGIPARKEPAADYFKTSKARTTHNPSEFRSRVSATQIN